jgi:anti-sigma factor RsiW
MHNLHMDEKMNAGVCNNPSSGLIDLFLRGQVSEEERRAVESHVSQCAACQRKVNQMMISIEHAQETGRRH